MRKILLVFISLLLALTPCFASSSRSTETFSGEIELRNGTIVTYEEMVENIAQSKGIEVEEVKREIPDIAKEKNASSNLQYNYFYLTQQFTVTNEYKPEVSLYCMGWYNPNVTTMKTGLVEIVNADIDREYKGITKQFSGKLFIKMESAFKVHWDVNGDFFNNGSTTTSGGITVNVKVGESGNINFTLNSSSTTNHYKYCHTYGDIRYGS